jgi:hypothetical protein
MQPTYINNNFSLVTGTKIGINLDNNIFAGLALYGSTLFKNEIDAIDNTSSFSPVLEIYYYGLETEYFIMPEDVLHPSFSLFVGMSDVFLNAPYFSDETENVYNPDYLDITNRLVFQPTVNINLNLKSFYRVVLGVSYRYVSEFNNQIESLKNKSDSGIYNLSSNDVNGFAINFAVKFGKF